MTNERGNLNRSNGAIKRPSAIGSSKNRPGTPPPFRDEQAEMRRKKTKKGPLVRKICSRRGGGKSVEDGQLTDYIVVDEGNNITAVHSSTSYVEQGANHGSERNVFGFVSATSYVSEAFDDATTSLANFQDRDEILHSSSSGCMSCIGLPWVQKIASFGRS